MTATERQFVDALLSAYGEGVFPMSEPGGGVYWYDPDPRGVIPLGDGALRITRSLRRSLRSPRLRITTDRAFGAVIRACAEARAGQAGSWIDGRIVRAYEALHRAGHAHSVEAWLTAGDAGGGPGVTGGGNGGVLVGGLYGVHLRGLFAGESMFSRPDLGGTDASKVCLVHLWRHLRTRGFTLLDTQFLTPHLASLGGVEIPRAEYRRRLGGAMRVETAWAPFEAIAG
jgi:leucyl/phenylalanyl-tRNA--protein transferase